MENMNKSDLRIRKRALKTKLMSALALLLVASIMMGTSTYAWFVLSTAPEVKGMSTTVGANGSLEIALQSSVSAENPARAQIGNGFSYENADVSVVNANKTWGNIVALNDNSYGFNDMKLYPTRLNIDSTAATDTINKNNPLVTAKYGVDGRVTTVDKLLTTGVYNEGAFVEGFGVRGIGDYVSSAAMSVDVSYGTIVTRAIDEINQRTSGLASTLGSSFNKNLITLQNVGSLSDDALLTSAQTKAVLDLMNSVRGEALSMQEALGYALMGERANASYNFATYDAPTSAMALYNKYALMTASQIAEMTGIGAPSAGLKTAAEHLASTITNLDNAIAAMNASADANEDAQGKHMVASVAKNNVTVAINYQAMTFVTPTQTVPWGSIPGSGTDKLSWIQEQPDGTYAYLNNAAGAMASLAEIAGDYQFTLGSADLGFTIPMTVTSASSFNGTLQEGALAVSQSVFEASADSTTKAFDYIPNGGVGNTYGMAVDLAFRANTATSLLLSTDQALRVSNATNADLLGGGSTLDFGVASLNTAVVVVFMDTDTGELYAVAKTNGTTSSLVLCAYTITDGVLTVGDPKTGENASVITALQANTEKFITAIVFLDGDIISESPSAPVSGTLNLQFASSTTLQPMPYDWGTGTGGQATPTAPNATVAVGEDVDLTQLTAYSSVVDAGDTVAWSISEGSEFVTVNDGVVHGVAAGTAKVVATVTPGDSSPSYTIEFVVEVTAP